MELRFRRAQLSINSTSPIFECTITELTDNHCLRNNLAITELIIAKKIDIEIRADTYASNYHISSSEIMCREAVLSHINELRENWRIQKLIVRKY